MSQAGVWAQLDSNRSVAARALQETQGRLASLEKAGDAILQDAQYASSAREAWQQFWARPTKLCKRQEAYYQQKFDRASDSEAHQPHASSSARRPVKEIRVRLRRKESMLQHAPEGTQSIQMDAEIEHEATALVTEKTAQELLRQEEAIAQAQQLSKEAKRHKQAQRRARDQAKLKQGKPLAALAMEPATCSSPEELAAEAQSLLSDPDQALVGSSSAQICALEQSCAQEVTLAAHSGLQGAPPTNFGASHLKASLGPAASDESAFPSAMSDFTPAGTVTSGGQPSISPC